ncbi:hypothetical protein [Streptomyces antimicrobicus]|uniref:Transmembrane protein n=1 Tax=Streptomyces antimicrobicus TaxID=2883108 RepID=A0ABS8B0D8_9ACTN|nr:hypothetical protein [Streptomyces antimicrobicus]MCB5178052.1 hypothetical protein [Streptomyces antimicrobicus]
MHMTSASHLLTEDRPEFHRLLDEALRTAHERPGLTTLGERLNAEQLRTMALNAQALLTAAAATEYDHYVKVREQLREDPLAAGAEEDDGDGDTGAGVIAVIAVLAPVLAGTAMLIFLLVGYVLKLVEPEPAFADTLLTAGWVFGGLTVVSLLLAAVGLLVAAVRNSATEVVAQRGDAVPDEVSRARDAWRRALLEQGIVPFLQDALAGPGAGPGVPATGPGAAPGAPAPHTPRAGRIPDLGYTRPGYTAPDFTSPDVEGPQDGPR